MSNTDNNISYSIADSSRVVSFREHFIKNEGQNVRDLIHFLPLNCKEIITRVNNYLSVDYSQFWQKKRTKSISNPEWTRIILWRHCTVNFNGAKVVCCGRKGKPNTFNAQLRPQNPNLLKTIHGIESNDGRLWVRKIGKSKVYYMSIGIDIWWTLQYENAFRKMGTTVDHK